MAILDFSDHLHTEVQAQKINANINKAERKELHQTSTHQIGKNEVANRKHCAMMGRKSNPSVTQLDFQLPDE